MGYLKEIQWNETELSERMYVRKNFWWMLIVHATALFIAPFFFRWDAFLWGWSFVFIFAYSMGIFHHMMFTHDSFQSKRWVRILGALLGTLSWRGPFSGPLMYVAGHTIHHKYSDTFLDPHTPKNGLFHAFLGWYWNMTPVLQDEKKYHNYIEDTRLTSDPALLFIDRNVHLLQFLWALSCFALGTLIEIKGGLRAQLLAGATFVLYGVFVKTVLLIWMADTVDVINHTIGYRNYETQDASTNSFIMAAVHLGGAISWHNNHHAEPNYFSVKKKWWEFDAHYLFLKVLEKFGLVWKIEYLDLSHHEK